MPLRRVALAAALLALLAAAAGVAAAPYLPRLLSEGYPAPRWPAAGTFAAVTGDALAEPFPAAGAIDAWSDALLAESGGAALLVHQGGRLRLSRYRGGATPETRFNSYSMAKSLIGALLLKAVAEGRVASLEDPIGRYLPQAGDAAFRAAPLSAFLAMRSGVAFEAGVAKQISGPRRKDLEGYRLNPFGPMARLHFSGLAAIAAELRIIPARRGVYAYQNVNTALLGAVLERAYGQPLERLLAEKIWRPAGAAPADWRRHGPESPVTPYCCLYATASDWLRVGLFLMRNGAPESRFLPEALWRRYLGAAVSPEARASGAYGAHVYHDVLDRAGEPLQGPFTYLFGRGGQIVYMMPERDLVVVRFGETPQLLHSTLYAAWRSLDATATPKRR